MVSPIGGYQPSFQQTPIPHLINQVNDLINLLQTGNKFAILKELDSILSELQMMKTRPGISAVIDDLTQARQLLSTGDGNPVGDAEAMLEDALDVLSRLR